MVQHSKLINVIHSIDKWKNKQHVIISSDADKAYYKIQHPFIIITSCKLGMRRTLLHTRQNRKIQSHYHTEWEDAGSKSNKIWNQPRMPTFTSLLFTSSGGCRQSQLVRITLKNVYAFPWDTEKNTKKDM